MSKPKLLGAVNVTCCISRPLGCEYVPVFVIIIFNEISCVPNITDSNGFENTEGAKLIPTKVVKKPEVGPSYGIMDKRIGSPYDVVAVDKDEGCPATVTIHLNNFPFPGTVVQLIAVEEATTTQFFALYK